MKKLKNFDTIILVDFSNLAHACMNVSAYEHGENEKLYFSTAIYLSIRKLISQVNMLKENKTAIVLCLDSFPAWKRKVYPNYKANRDKMDEEKDIRPTLLKILKETGCFSAFCDGEEADDVIATIVRKTKGKNCYVISSDKDLYQVKKFSHVDILNLTKNTIVTKNELEEKFGLKRWSLVPLYKMCFGDPSDNIAATLPRVRKKDILPVMNKSRKFKDFIELLSKSKQSDRTNSLVKSNKSLMKSVLKIVKLNYKLKFKLTEGKRNFKNFDAYLKNLEIKAIDRNSFNSLT